MTRSLIVLSIACAALWAGLAGLGSDSQRTAARPVMVQVVDALRPGDEPVAGLSLAYDGGEERVLYARSKGLWRCLAVWNAPADGARRQRPYGFEYAEVEPLGAARRVARVKALLAMLRPQARAAPRSAASGFASKARSRRAPST